MKSAQSKNHKEIQKLRNLILEGAASEISSEPLNKKYFDALRERVKKTRLSQPAEQAQYL